MGIVLNRLGGPGYFEPVSEDCQVRLHSPWFPPELIEESAYFQRGRWEEQS